MGFALLFIGLQFLKESVPDIKNNPQILDFIKHYTDLGYLSYFIFLLIGTILTIVIQSSSATMALTLVMCNNGWIQFDMAAAMVLGENIGTTITANLAAIVANATAKRAARAHLIFNIFGVVWVLAIFPIFLYGIKKFCIAMGIGDPYVTNTEMGLSVFHTAFNIINVLLLIWIAKIVMNMIKLKKDEEEEFRLSHINTGMLSTPEASIFQAKEEIANFSKFNLKMFKIVRETFSEMNEKQFVKNAERVQKYEDISDNIEVEIATFLTKVTETRLTAENSRKVRTMYKLVSDLEFIADSSYNITKALIRKKEQKAWFPQEIRDNLNKMFDLVEIALTEMIKNLNGEYATISVKKAHEIEKKINEFRTILKHDHIENIENKKYKYQAGIIYNDIYSECEKIGDYALNVSVAINEIKQ